MNRRAFNSLIGAYIFLAVCIIATLAIAIHTASIPEPLDSQPAKWEREANDQQGRHAAELKSAIE